MTHNQIEASRERRLWLRDVIIPAGIGLVYLRSNPNTKAWMDDKYNKAKNYVQSKIDSFKKKESE